MCMLSFYPPGVLPKQTRLENGAEVNPDGHGFAIVTGDRKLLIQKSMDAEDLIDRFIRLRHIHPDGPALFHSRIATSGLVDITGCHPFTVGGDVRTVVAHNGILFSPGPKSLRSDTRIFAEDILPRRFRKLDRGKTQAQLRDYCGYSNKLVILTVNPARRETAYLVNGNQGHWVDGEWHSNYDYSGWSARSWKSYPRHDWDNSDDSRYEPWPCDICGSQNSVDTLTLVCSVCRTCNDCQMHLNDCQCFYGQNAPAKSAEESARVFESHAALGTDTGCAFNGDRCVRHDSFRSIFNVEQCVKQHYVPAIETRVSENS
jgi:hypothetical protein